MKNFWLDRRGPAKTKINIWLGQSITGGEEELIGTSEFPTYLYFSPAGTHKTTISVEIDDMLYHHRIGVALVNRKELGLFNGKPVPAAVMKAQWTAGEGNKLFREEKLNPNNKLMPFYVFHIRNEAAYKSGATAGYIDKTDWKAVKNEV